MATVSYTVNACRADDVWHVHVVEIDRVTQARTVDEVEPMARDLVEIMTGEADAELDVRITLPEPVAERLAEVQRLRGVEAEARTAAARVLRDAALGLKGRSMSVREIGKVLGISHQRASQLTSGKP